MRLTWIILFLFSGLCLSGVWHCSGGKDISQDAINPPLKDVDSGHMDLPYIETDTADTPPRRLGLLITLMYMTNHGFSKEINIKKDALIRSIKTVVGTQYHRDLKTVEGYEKLREDILQATNKGLSRGKVLKVLFREYQLN